MQDPQAEAIAAMTDPEGYVRQYGEGASVRRTVLEWRYMVVGAEGVREIIIDGPHAQQDAMACLAALIYRRRLKQT
jgi:hypothetical protein